MRDFVIKSKALKNQTYWIYLLVLFVCLQSFLVSSVYGVDFSCPGGQWVQVSHCSRTIPVYHNYIVTTFYDNRKYMYSSDDESPEEPYPATCIHWTAGARPFTCSGEAILPGPDEGKVTGIAEGVPFSHTSICSIWRPYDWVQVLRSLTVYEWRCPAVCTNGQTKPCPYTGPPNTENVGICKAGIQTCVNGQWGACVGEVLPQAEICGNDKDENCDGNIDEGCAVCEVSVKVSPLAVWPQKTGGKTEADVVATLSKPAPSGGCNISFNVEPVAYSGGHNHHDADSPKGTIAPNSISFSEGDVGSKSAKYKSSEVSGEEKIKVKVNDKDTSETIIHVRVPGFFELGAGDGYALIGQTTTHPANHYGTENALYSLLDLADAFSETGKGTLRINDISLIWGGLFDIKANWSSPHKSHRIGKNVDVDDVTAEGKKVRSTSLKKVAEKLGIKVTILDEGNHLHLSFP